MKTSRFLLRGFKRPREVASESLGKLEQDVLKEVWRREEVSVRDVYLSFGETIAYTTLMTTLDRLFKKKLLTRRKDGRAFIYLPAVSSAELEQGIREDVIEGLLGHGADAVQPVLACIVDTVSQRDRELLDELDRLIKRKAQRVESRRQLMFELLGLALLLATLLTFNSLASFVMAGLWRVVRRWTDSWSATSRARLLFSLRILPAVLAFLSVALLLIPSYLAYEPRHTAEPVSFKLGLLAILSATGLSVSLYRGLAAYRATAKLTSDWLRQGKAVQIAGIEIEAYEIEHPFPLIAIVGFLRPKLFVASHVLRLLTPEEISAAVAHENGHLIARDNLKRGLLQACRDALLIVPSGRSLDRAWSEASEEAADENAARQGNGVALDLASALVKIARKIPQGARPTMPAGVFLLGDEETKGIKSRVRRLIALAAVDRRPAGGDGLSRKLLVWVPAGVLFATLVCMATSPVLLSRVHTLIEHAVFALR